MTPGYMGGKDWQTTGTVSEGCAGVPVTVTARDPPSPLQAFLQGEGQGEAVGQLVRGGLYEVDMLRRRMRFVYWPEHAHRISRGAWFVEKSPDWVPPQGVLPCQSGFHVV